MPAWPWLRCIPTRSRRAGRAIASLEASQTALTASCWPSSRIPIAAATPPRSMPAGSGSGARERYPTYRALAADAGQAPVAVESGKAKHAQFRWACDHRLRQAFCTLADASRRHNPWAADIYDRARARGASHTQRHPHPRSCLEPNHLATLARPRHLRPTPPHRPPAPHRSRRLTQGVYKQHSHRPDNSLRWDR
jgi:hypothetical protein